MTNHLNALLFGSCLVRRPLHVAAREQGGFEPEPYGPVPAVHTFGEMIQIIEVLRGHRTIPRELWSLCRLPPKVMRAPRVADFSRLDVALIEPALPIEMSFRGTPINRDGLQMHVLKPIEKAGGPDARKLTNRWLRNGLIAMNEKVRADVGAKLLGFITGDSEADILARAVIRELEVSKSDLAGGFAKIRELLGCPVGAVVYVFGYMPDGRIISWPPGFRESVMAAAEQAELAMFEPTPLVLSYGVDAALAHDSRHYSEAFLPVVGKALIEFAHAVHDGARPPAAP